MKTFLFSRSVAMHLNGIIGVWMVAASICTSPYGWLNIVDFLLGVWNLKIALRLSLDQSAELEKITEELKKLNKK